MTEQHFTIKQAAEKLSVSYSYLWREVKKGTLAVTRLGDGLRIAESDLEKFLAARKSLRRA